MSRIEARLAELGVHLPEAPKPVASYIPANRSGNIVVTSGQLPTRSGELIHKGIVGQNVTEEQALEAAHLCAVNNLAVIKALIGDLDKIVKIVKITVFVASAQTYTTHPKIANGASNFLQDVFGDAGRHARSTIGVAVLPLNAPVEVEMMVEVKD